MLEKWSGRIITFGAVITVLIVLGSSAIKIFKDSSVAQLRAMGSPHRVTCYAGTAVIYQGESTGNVSSEGSSDGWFWKDTKTGKLVEASGTCLFEQE